MNRRIFYFLFFIFYLNIGTANASWGIVDALSLAPFVPLVVDALMTVAMAGFDFFAGGGFGIIHALVWAWLAITLALMFVRMYMPGKWTELFGLKSDNSLADSKMGGIKLGEKILKPCIRAIVAVTILLQIQPRYITELIVDPFLQFGALYTESIGQNIWQSNIRFGTPPDMSHHCASIVENRFLTQRGCVFLIQPVADITHANNIAIKRGLDFFRSGLGGLIRIIPAIRGDAFMDLITGVILIMTFVSANLFMALLIIQAIFVFGMALVFYPFKVLKYVAKPDDPDAWISPWEVFKDIINALRGIVITMIAAMFIAAINIAIITAMFNWNQSVFMPVAGGAAHSNVPTVAAESAIGFGMHSVTWLSAILTFYLMLSLFQMTREQLYKYTKGNSSDDLYKKTTGDFHKARRATFGKGGYMDKSTSAVKWIRKRFWKK